MSGMAGVRWGILGALWLTHATQGLAMSKMEMREDELPVFEFTEHCAGRYQLELPANMKLIDSGYNDELILASVYPPDEVRHDTAYRGEYRVDEWRSRVEEVRNKEVVETHYVHSEPEGDLETLVYYTDRRKIPGMREKPDRSHKFETHFLKDFPSAKAAIAIQGQGALGNVSRDEADYKAIYHERLTQMQERANALEYYPWPHNKPGVCQEWAFGVVNTGTPDGSG